MPFTLAHPAIIVPLTKPLKKWGVLSALVIGSMTPDFGYFIPLGVSRHQTHSILALFWFCLPIGLGVFYMFHVLLAPVLLSIAPKGFQRRLGEMVSSGLSFKVPILAIVISLFVGASSHIFWDVFTHPPYALPKFLSDWMNIVVFTADGYIFYLFMLFQHLSTFIGLGFLAYWISQWYQGTSSKQSYVWEVSRGLKMLTFLSLAILPIFFGLYYAYLSATYIITTSNQSTTHVIVIALYSFVIYGGRFLLLNWLFLGVYYYVLRRKRVA